MCKPKIKKMNKFVTFITFGWAAGITLSPFGIYIKDKYWDLKYTLPTYWNNLINHELIHWKQQMEMLIIFFYLWYVIEWFIKLFKYGKKSYYNISFEREAKTNENNSSYIENRKLFSWIKYL